MSPDPSPIVIYPSRAKMAGIFLGGNLFVLLGVLFLAMPDEFGVPVLLLVITSYIEIPIFGLCALYALRRLIVRRPVLVIDRNGIDDRSSLISAGLMGWDEIEAVTPYRFRGQWMLGILPVDSDAVIARQRWYKRLLIRQNERLGCPPVNIPQVVLPMDVHALADRLSRDFCVEVHETE